MPRRRSDAGDDGLNTPFRRLRQILPAGRLREADGGRSGRKTRERSSATPRRGAPAGSGDGPSDDGKDLFRSATEGVVPLGHGKTRHVTGRLPPGRARALDREREDLEVISALCDLVSGTSVLELSETDEHAEGAVVGLDPRVMRKLRDGDLAWQSHLDLHGMTTEEAQAEVRRFLLRALRAGHRCVLIVHGRGRNSPDRRPVLRDGLRRWLARGELAHVVLAFCTARPRDGGGGATYVLLRRERRPRKPFRTVTATRDE